MGERGVAITITEKGLFLIIAVHLDLGKRLNLLKREGKKLKPRTLLCKSQTLLAFLS